MPDAHESFGQDMQHKASDEFLNGQMREIRDSGKVVGLDRIAVMAALNMANELLQLRTREDAVKSTLGTRLKALSERADQVLGDTGQLKL